MKYLNALLNDDVPKADWKKLNRKATFKMKYKRRSGNILDTLADLQKTFETNLADAQKKEKDAIAAYNKLKGSKTDVLDSVDKALNDMSLENGARGKSKQEAQDEVDALEAQVAADTKFIKEAEEAFKIKDKEWAGRKDLRSQEILAMSQAIAVLASDDAKDLMKESFKSQGYNMLIQEGASPAMVHKARMTARDIHLLVCDPMACAFRFFCEGSACVQVVPPFPMEAVWVPAARKGH